jgi:hypothetical protein
MIKDFYFSETRIFSRDCAFPAQNVKLCWKNSTKGHLRPLMRELRSYGSD